MILDVIKALAKQKGITITELERILGFGNGTIQKWGNSQPSLDKVIKVANYFNISIDALVNENKSLPSADSLEFAKVFDLLQEYQKNLVRCYISVIRNVSMEQETCTNSIS